eukprot:tig00000655_g2886.t1
MYEVVRLRSERRRRTAVEVLDALGRSPPPSPAPREGERWWDQYDNAARGGADEDSEERTSRSARTESDVYESGESAKRARVGGSAECTRDSERSLQGSSAGPGGTSTANALARAREHTGTTSTQLLDRPKNDYSLHFVTSGQRPQNFVRDADMHDRLEEYPKLRELFTLKEEIYKRTAPPPFYLQCDLRTFDLASLSLKFDVILVDPPWPEYARRYPGLVTDSWSFEEMARLRIDAVADSRCFLFLWVGSSEGLDHGRQLMRRWGFRRCEDVCWLKTNVRRTDSRVVDHDKESVLKRVKEHLLVGIRGTVRRSTDGDFIHANVDTDIVIAEEPPHGSLRKPEEVYHVVEHFCLGQRRLELFGETHNIRQGWLTLGRDLVGSSFSRPAYLAALERAGPRVPTTPQIEALRPKSPPRGGPRLGAGPK